MQKILQDFKIEAGILTEYTGSGGHIVVPNDVEVLGDFCFAKCNSYKFGSVKMESITLPDSLREIGRSVFVHCDHLKEVVIPNSVEVIGSYAFDSLKSLRMVQLPSNLTSIGAYAFCNCPIEELVLPERLREIGEGAFMNEKLSKVLLPDNIESMGKNAFAGQMYAFFTLIVKKESKTEKVAENYAKKHKTNIKFI